MEQQHHGRAVVSPFLLYLAILSILTGIAYVGRPVLLPFAIAVVIWFIIQAFAHAIHGRSVAGRRVPFMLSYGLVIVLILIGLVYVTGIISANIAGIAAAAAGYEANLDQLILSTSEFFALGDLPDLRALLAKIDISLAVRRVALSLGDLLGSTGLILIYVAFLLVEQRVFNTKFNAFYADPDKGLYARRVLETITTQIEAYLRIKTLTSMLTGALSYAVLWWFEVDFAGFWAIIIFLLNYIPTIGSLLGVVFPAFITLVNNVFTLLQ
jgi:predicted PurR-regulated permease PerM